MKILLTGSNGFLGKLILKELENQNEVLSLSRSSKHYKISLEKSIPFFKDKFEVIIHSAGKAHSIPKTEIQKKEFYEINVIGTQNLLKGLNNSTLPSQFVFISSVAVYGKNIGNNIDESHPLQAKDPYGKSKIEAENLIINWCKQNNVICTIFRLPLLIGKNAPGNFGAMVKAIEKGYYFNIGKGTARKSMVLAEDVASLIIKAAAIGGIYNLTDGIHPSFNELSLAISKNKNKKKPLSLPVSVVKWLSKLGDFLGDKSPINSLKLIKITSDLTFDDNKARTVLNWRPRSIINYIEDNVI